MEINDTMNKNKRDLRDFRGTMIKNYKEIEKVFFESKNMNYFKNNKTFYDSVEIKDYYEDDIEGSEIDVKKIDVKANEESVDKV